MIGHLIHIGYPKTGSTFLRHWFADHPQLAYSHGGIAAFANVYEISRQSAAPPEGLLYRVTSSEILAAPQAHPGHGSFGIGQDPRAQAQVRDALVQLFPTAHVLLVTRGFRSAILSGYSEYVRAGGDADFRGFLEMSRRAAESGRRVWDYDFLIGLYAEAFGERLIVMPYELLRDDAQQFTRRLETRLGLAHHLPRPQRANPSLSPEELAWYPRLGRALGRLPFGQRLGRRLLARQAHDRSPSGLRPLIGLLRLAAPDVKITQDMVTEDMVDFLRGRASLLKPNPLYEAYAKDYLLRGDEAA